MSFDGKLMGSRRNHQGRGCWMRGEKGCWSRVVQRRWVGDAYYYDFLANGSSQRTFYRWGRKRDAPPCGPAVIN